MRKFGVEVRLASNYKDISTKVQLRIAAPTRTEGVVVAVT